MFALAICGKLKSYIKAIPCHLISEKTPNKADTFCEAFRNILDWDLHYTGCKRGERGSNL